MINNKAIVNYNDDCTKSSSAMLEMPDNQHIDRQKINRFDRKRDPEEINYLPNSRSFKNPNARFGAIKVLPRAPNERLDV